MAESKGMLTLDQLERLVHEQQIDTVQVVFTDLYGRFLGKRFDAGFFLKTIAQDRNPCV